VFVFANFSGALATLAWDYATTTDPRTRLQLKFWLLGVSIALPLGVTNLLPAYGISFYPLGNLANVAWAGVVAYAVVRHRLMDIQLVLTKGIAYAAVAAVLIAPVLALALWLQKLSFGSIHNDFSFALLVLLIVVGVLFPILLERIEPRVERSWIREKREYRAAIVEFTRSIFRIFEQKRLVRELASTLQKSLQLDRVAVALGDQGYRCFTVRQAFGVPPQIAEFGIDEPLLRLFRSDGRAMLRHELSAVGTVEAQEVVRKVLNPNGWEVCIPLQSNGQLLGFIALGRKPNLEAFFAEDLELLETLAAETSVALENARLYEELKRSQDIIRRADRSSALGTLAAGIAHEIRNPLVSIQTFFQLAPHRLNDNEFMTEFLSLTANEVKRISSLINELLSFARSPTPSYGPVDLNQLVERVMLLISPEAKKHRIHFESALSVNIPVVYGDSEQIRQVLINLVFNAFQATPEGGSVEIVTRCIGDHSAEFGRIEVRDTGCGIPAGELESVFNPFYTTKVKGTGLGLAITQRIVSEHGGTIVVDSQEGIGTTFLVDFPTTASQPAGPNDQACEVDMHPRNGAS
jgi:signal transduction histidine kinase